MTVDATVEPKKTRRRRRQKDDGPQVAEGSDDIDAEITSSAKAQASSSENRKDNTASSPQEENERTIRTPSQQRKSKRKKKRKKKNHSSRRGTGPQVAGDNQDIDLNAEHSGDDWKENSDPTREVAREPDYEESQQVFPGAYREGPDQNPGFDEETPISIGDSNVALHTDRQQSSRPAFLAVAELVDEEQQNGVAEPHDAPPEQSPSGFWNRRNVLLFVIGGLILITVGVIAGVLIAGTDSSSSSSPATDTNPTTASQSPEPTMPPSSPPPTLPSAPTLPPDPCDESFPDPIISFSRVEEIQGNTFERQEADEERYIISIDNYLEFSPDFFTSSPEFGPCGENKNASRALVEIFSRGGELDVLESFCDLSSSPAEVSFEAIPGEVEDATVIFTDRGCNDVEYRSNTVSIPTRPPSPAPASPPDPCDIVVSDPLISFARVEEIQGSTTRQIEDDVRYVVSIDNHEEFSTALFAESPELGPCGGNISNASRTEIEIFSRGQDGTIVQNFCTLSTSPSEVAFDAYPGEVPGVVVVFTDRKCDEAYTSNTIAIPTRPPSPAPTPLPTPDPCDVSYPIPSISFVRVEQIQFSERFFIRIDNSDEFSADLFAASPELDSCGQNNNASRTYIDIFSRDVGEDIQLLNRFCTLSSSPAGVWFVSNLGEVEFVFVVFQDRRCNMDYRSNTIRIPTTQNPTPSPTPPPTSDPCDAFFPNPILSFSLIEGISIQDSKRQGGDRQRYSMKVENFLQFSDDLFAPSPHLELCGTNTTSRTRIEVFSDDAEGSLSTFCSFFTPPPIVWFEAYPREILSAFVVFTDLECGVPYISNVIDIP